jgi:hypothetical protein
MLVGFCKELAMPAESRFSTELYTLHEAPSTLQSLVSAELRPDEPVRLIVHKPAEIAGGIATPPKLLAITDTGFVFAETTASGVPHVLRVGFESVLLVELATLLMYGRFKVDFAHRGVTRSVAMEFNTVAEPSYRRAAALVLAGASLAGYGPRDARAQDEPPLNLDCWPAGLRDAVAASILPGRPPRTGAWWHGIHGGFGWELAPAGAVISAGAELIIVVQEHAAPGGRLGPGPAFATIAAYLPSNHLGRVDSHSTETFSLLTLSLHGQHAHEPFQFIVPRQREPAVTAVVADAFCIGPHVAG